MFASLLSFLFLSVLALLIGLPLLANVAYFYWRWSQARAFKAQQLRAGCMICDALVDEALDGTYVCKACGFDVSWQETGRKVQVNDARELRRAVGEFQLGLHYLGRATQLSKFNVWGIGRTDQKYGAMQTAEDHFVEARRMLSELVKKHPELADFPFPSELLAEISSNDSDVGGLLFVIILFPVRLKVRNSFIDALAQAEAAVAVLEGTLAIMGEEIQATPL